ncbi:MAG TPA: hypothetical protein VMR62_30840 [Bryobacteraceae bacterium]|jgi:hypothetical protein|nr:hypothetical protein [Bryobacteraceae bacterium]
MRSCFLMAGGILASCVCFGQSIWIGGIGGGMVTDEFSSQFVTSVSKRYVVGPELDIGLPLGLGFEADALYRREGFQSSDLTTHENGNSWQFPLLLKYRLPFPLVKPVLECGYAPRVINGPISDYASPVSHGIVIGGGVQFGIGRLRLSPVVRYTHWNNVGVVVVFPNGPTIQSAQNQVDILVGVGWKVR